MELTTDHVGTLLRRYDEDPTATLQCTLCLGSSSPPSQSPVTRYCLTCYELFCRDCSKKHGRLAPFKTHVQADVNLATLEGLTCADHNQRFVQQFCLTCAQSVCKVCIHTTHRNNPHRNIKFAASTTVDMGPRRDTCKFLECALDEMNSTKSELTRVREESKKQLEETKKLVTKRVWDQLELLQKSLHEQERILHERIDEYHAQITANCEKLEGQLETAADILSDIYETARSVLTPLHGNTNITSSIFPAEKFQELYTELAIPSTGFAPRELNDIYVAGDGVNLGVIHLPDQVQLSFDVILKVPHNQCRVLWRDKNFTQTVDVCFAGDGVLHTQLNDRASPLIFHIAKVDTYGHEQMLPPAIPTSSQQYCTIGSNQRGTMSAILTNAFDLSWNLVFLQGSSPSTSLETIGVQPAGQPISMAITLAGNIVVTTIEDPDAGRGPTSLRCHLPGGKLLWCKNTSRETGAGELLTPWAVCVDPLDRILVADFDGGCVKIYDHRGGYLRTLKPDSDRDFRPTSVSADRRGYVYVALSDQRCVSLFTPSGQFVRHVLKTESCPKAIAVRDGNMAVATETGIEMIELT